MSGLLTASLTPHAVRDTTLLRRWLSIARLCVHSVRFEDEQVVAEVSLRGCSRCSRCKRKRPRYDRLKPSRWRHLDYGERRLFLEMARWRVNCPQCGIVAEQVPWSDPSSRFTHAFEDQVTWLLQRCDKTSVSTLMGIAWRTVGKIIERAVGRHRKPVDWKAVRNIGIDELSHRKGYRYLTLVTDLDEGRHLWGHEGKSAATLDAFFDEIGPETCQRIKNAAIDMNAAYETTISRRLSSAVIVYDRFHVQRLVSDAVDETRREEWRRLRGTADATVVKHTRYALLKNPWNLTARQSESLSRVQDNNKRLFRAYLLKESFADIFRSIRAPWAAKRRMRKWLAWASRSKLNAFVKVARVIRQRLDGIIRYFEGGFSNGPAEGLNNKARLATRQAYGFHSTEAVLAMIDLRCTGLRISLPRF